MGTLKGNNPKKLAIRALRRTALALFHGASLFAGLIIPSPTLADAPVGKMVADVCQTSTDAAFREKYCKAAQDTKKSYVANRSTAAVWGGVSAICLAACGKTYADAGVVCKGSSMGGGLAEGAITQKFTESLTGGATSATGLAKSLAAKNETAAAASKSKVDVEACQTSATTALKSYEKISTAKANSRSLATLRDQTQEMNTGKTGGSNYMAGTAGSGSADTTTGSLSRSGASAGEICGDSAFSSALGSIRCAVTADPSLPTYVQSETYLKDLAKATGKSPDDFFAGFESPAKSLFDSPAMGTFPTSGQQGAAVALADMSKFADQNVGKNGTTSGGNDGYRTAGSAGGRKLEGEDPGFDMNSALAGLMAPAAGEKEAAPGVDSVAIAQRAPANFISPEDRKVSIFDRVRWRYGAVTARDHLGMDGVGK